MHFNNCSGKSTQNMGYSVLLVLIVLQGMIIVCESAVSETFCEVECTSRRPRSYKKQCLANGCLLTSLDHCATIYMAHPSGFVCNRMRGEFVCAMNGSSFMKIKRCSLCQKMHDQQTSGPNITQVESSKVIARHYTLEN
ncbi:uncharacterized protein LOC100186817 [Ciona intestinalis]